MRRTALARLLPPLCILASCAPTTAPAPPAPVPTPAAAPSPVAPPRIVTLPPAGPTGPVELCGRGTVQRTADGRLFNHFPYPDMPATALVDAPATLGGSCKVHPAMAADLARLLAAADADPAISGTLRAVSCHRSEALQRITFCGGIGANGSGSFAERAWASAPPGHSEHSTGYVIDFGTSTSPACNAEACFAATPTGRWLRANAARFGFEMSFPPGTSSR